MQIITKKARHTLKETIVVFHTTLIFIPQRSAILRKIILCQDFLEEIHHVEPMKNVTCHANTRYN